MMLDNLKKYGWCITYARHENLDQELLSIARSLGKPIGSRKKSNVIETLKPTSTELANKNSLSYKFSLNEFPLHNDTSHWQIPCRYIVLGCKDSGNCHRQTLLLDFNSLVITDKEKALLKDSVFLFKNGRRSFFSSILQYDKEFMRFDPGCMEPTDNKSKYTYSLFYDKLINSEKIQISWLKLKIIIIDNWRILHGRGFSNKVNSGRELRRVLVV